MRIGVIGLGYWGSKHVRVLSAMPSVARVVCFDVDPDRRRDIAAAFPAASIASDLRELLGSVDGVVVATHPSTHVTLASQAITAGVHTLVEKPLALTSRDAALLVELAHARGCLLMVGHTFVYNPAVTALRELVASGHLGDVLHIHSQRLNLGLYQSDCDVVWDLAPHDISIIQTLTGLTPTSVRSFGRGHVHRPVVDNAYVMMEYEPSGMQAVVHVSWLDPHKVRQTTVVGSQRMAVFDDLADDSRLRVYDKGVMPSATLSSHEKPFSYRYGDIRAPYIPSQEPLVLEDQHFVECIATGAQPLTGGDAGLEVVRVLEAASTSLLEGREVHLAEIDARPKAREGVYL